MPLSILFWVLFIFTLLFSGWNGWAPVQPGQGPAGFRMWGNSLLYLVLIGIIGWKVFGAAVTGQ